MKSNSSPLRFIQAVSLALSLLLPTMGELIPAELPSPDGKPPSKDKPVKVYIQSGQSNSLGFGRIEGASPTYTALYFSPDPVVETTVLPFGRSAILAHGLFQSTAEDAAAGGIASVYPGDFDHAADYGSIEPAKREPVILGGVDHILPSIEGAHTVVVEAALEVPYGGSYQVFAGFGDSSQAIVTVDGKEAYRKTSGEPAALNPIKLEKGKRYPVKIVFLKGGPAAFWLEKADLEGMGDLRWFVEKRGKYKTFVDAKGEWVSRNDVILNDAYMGKGKSAPMGPPACGDTFGPELGFGWVMGEFHDEPVIVIKADIGNRSLGWDILPPGSESYEFEGKIIPGYGYRIGDDGKPVKPADEKSWYAGKQYDDFTAAIREVLDNFSERYPEYADQGYEVAGFLWWQGHKDAGSDAHSSRYEHNLVNLIKAWRKEFNAPDAPWAIATVGFMGDEMPEQYLRIAEAQLAVADPKKHPELAGTVKTIDTRPFWRPAGMSPKDQFYHYNHNAETYLLTGDALGRAMVELKGGKAEYPDGRMDPSIEFIPALPMWNVKAEKLKLLSNVLRPIVVDHVIPDYLRKAPGMAAYQRKGEPIELLLANRAPKNPPKSLGSQLDEVIKYYETGGIDTYSWKECGPAMRTGEWHYHTFDPAEPLPNPKKSQVRYREVKLPEGMENWQAPEFDPAAAGWKLGKAPFGQVKGELKPLSDHCGVSHCRCDTPPATLWDKEVLLMRQTFDLGDFKPDHRYRLVVGGAGHTWTGEGFALYVNGELVSEEKAGNYKSGGAPRGVFFFEELQKLASEGKVTIAVKSFLRRSEHTNVEAPPAGHLSVFLQCAQLSPPVLKLAKDLEKK